MNKSTLMVILALGIPIAIVAYVYLKESKKKGLDPARVI